MKSRLTSLKRLTWWKTFSQIDQTDTEKIQRVIKTNLKNLYHTKVENLQEMDELLVMYWLQKIVQDEINNLNRPITSKETETYNYMD